VRSSGAAETAHKETKHTETHHVTGQTPSTDSSEWTKDNIFLLFLSFWMQHLNSWIFYIWQITEEKLVSKLHVSKRNPVKMYNSFHKNIISTNCFQHWYDWLLLDHWAVSCGSTFKQIQVVLLLAVCSTLSETLHLSPDLLRVLIHVLQVQ